MRRGVRSRRPGRGVFGQRGRRARGRAPPRGCRRAGVRHAGGPVSLTTAQQRARGFRQGLVDRGISPSHIHTAVAEYSFEGGRAGIRRLLEEHRDVDAVFACTDNQAIGGIFEAIDLGRSIPDDLLVCGFDDISWSSRLAPSLTTLRQDAEGMATCAALMLLEMITVGGEPRVEVFPVELVARDSTRRQGAWTTSVTTV